MIGQDLLKRTIHNLVSNDEFPRFSIFIGERGSQKELAAHYVAELMGCPCVDVEDIGVDSIRKKLDEMYQFRSPVVFNLHGCDKMSPQARASMLKVTEEPPNNVFIMMCYEGEEVILDTLMSRAMTFRFRPYSYEELNEYYDSKYTYDENKELLFEICRTPGEIDLFETDGRSINDMRDYVERFIDDVVKVGGAEAFELIKEVAIKDTDEGYDLLMFWRMFQSICLNNMKYGAVCITDKYMGDLRVRGINKKALVDSWILEIRKLWR